MEGRRIILNPGPDEIRLEGADAGYADGVLWLYMPGVTLTEAFALVTEPENIQRIHYEYGEMAQEYVGFTKPVTLREDDGESAAALKKPPEEVPEDV